MNIEIGAEHGESNANTIYIRGLDLEGKNFILVSRQFWYNEINFYVNKFCEVELKLCFECSILIEYVLVVILKCLVLYVLY